MDQPPKITDNQSQLSGRKLDLSRVAGLMLWAFVFVFGYFIDMIFVEYIFTPHNTFDFITPFELLVPGFFLAAINVMAYRYWQGKNIHIQNLPEKYISWVMLVLILAFGAVIYALITIIRLLPGLGFTSIHDKPALIVYIILISYSFIASMVYSRYKKYSKQSEL